MARKTWGTVVKDLRAALANSGHTKHAHPADVEAAEKKLQELYDLYATDKIDDRDFEKKKRKILSQI